MSAAQRLLLINPTITGKRHARFPLAVLSLSAALQDQASRRRFSTATSTAISSSARSARVVRERDVDAVGVTVMGGPQLLSAIAVSKAIRARAPAVPIIWGGAFPTVCPDAALNVPVRRLRGQGTGRGDAH